MSTVTLAVEVFSDVVCPWCYIGKRRLDQAIATLASGGDGGDPIEVVTTPRAFQLDPDAPLDHPTPVLDVYAKKFGGPERAEAIIAQVTEVAAADGLTFRLDRAIRANTLRAHRVIWWATRPGSPVDVDDVEERIMAAYFTEGRDIGSFEILADIAASAGAQRSDIVELLEGTDGVDEVDADLERAAALGITGVPTFVLGENWGITGAQDADTLVRLLRRYATGSENEPSADQPGR